MYSVLDESHIVTVCFMSDSVSQTPPTRRHTDPPIPTVDLSNIPDDSTLGE